LPDNIVEIVRTIILVAVVATLWQSHRHLEKQYSHLYKIISFLCIDVTRLYIKDALVDLQMGHMSYSAVKQMIDTSSLPDELKEQSHDMLNSLCEMYNIDKDE